VQESLNYSRTVQPRAVLRRVVRGHRPGRPPKCPPGWTTGPPDFVGVGAQRAGTTWWYQLIGAHPAVVAEPGDKELHYLTQYWQGQFTDADLARYSEFFPRPAGKLAGEWSPGYMAHFWVPSLLHEAAPDAKLLVIVRDPVERYSSGLALQSATRRQTFVGAGTAFRLGCYGSQLELLTNYFAREQILVLQHERCVKDTKSELVRTYRFLGIDDGFTPPEMTRRRNESRGAKPELSAAVREALTAAYVPEVARLQQLVPDLAIELWPSFAHV
jgi:Sulfotransferase domain